MPKSNKARKFVLAASTGTTKIVCCGCGETRSEYGYCEIDNKPFCQKCWGKHVYNCATCAFRNEG